MDRNRVVLFIGTLQFGGAERVLSILANGLKKHFNDVTILLYFDRKICYKVDEKIKVVIVEKETGRSNIIKNALWIRNYMKNNADFVISFISKFNMLSILCLFGLHKPIIVADRSDPHYEPETASLRHIRNFLYNFASHIVVQTQTNKEYFSKNLHKKITVIPNPISNSLEKGIALNAEKEKSIVSVGRLIETKNQALLIRAFSNIANAYIDYTLIFYGIGNLQNELLDLVKKLNLDNRVIFAGVEQNIFDKIKNAEIFVLSSNYEGMPNALLEAMCIGLPVISTKVSGAKDYIFNGVNGRLVECRDEQEMTTVLNELIENVEVRNRYAIEAVKVYDCLREETIIDRWLYTLKGIIK